MICVAPFIKTMLKCEHFGVCTVDVGHATFLTFKANISKSVVRDQI